MMAQNRAHPPLTALIIPRLRRMSEKPMTEAVTASMGGIARAKAHSNAELREWGELGGRPGKLDSKARAPLQV